MLQLAQIPEVKVINGSWYNRRNPDVTGTEQELYREIWEDHGVITVMAAGNGASDYGGPQEMVLLIMGDRQPMFTRSRMIMSFKCLHWHVLSPMGQIIQLGVRLSGRILM